MKDIILAMPKDDLIKQISAMPDDLWKIVLGYIALTFRERVVYWLLSTNGIYSIQLKHKYSTSSLRIISKDHPNMHRMYDQSSPGCRMNRSCDAKDIDDSDTRDSYGMICFIYKSHMLGRRSWTQRLGIPLYKFILWMNGKLQFSENLQWVDYFAPEILQAVNDW